MSLASDAWLQKPLAPHPPTMPPPSHLREPIPRKRPREAASSSVPVLDQEFQETGSKLKLSKELVAIPKQTLMRREAWGVNISKELVEVSQQVQRGCSTWTSRPAVERLVLDTADFRAQRAATGLQYMDLSPSSKSNMGKENSSSSGSSSGSSSSSNDLD